jgi:hypothetical protein
MIVSSKMITPLSYVFPLSFYAGEDLASRLPLVKIRSSPELSRDMLAILILGGSATVTSRSILICDQTSGSGK